LSVGLRHRLLAGIVVVALLTVGAMYVLFETTIRSLLVDKLGHRAVSVGRHLAAESETPVLTGEVLRLQLRLREYLQTEGDLSYVFLLDPREEVIAHSFRGGFPKGLSSANPLPAGASESRRAIRVDGETLLDVAVPILGGALGSVHLGMSEGAIDRDVTDLLRRMVLTMAGVVLLGGALSAVLASLATRPLEGLTRLAGQVAEGNFGEKAEVRADDEIGTLARAFNGMIDARSAHERDRERLVSELREALDNVKTLSGFLPICSHCKKIRNDAGYWQQVETYVTEHTGAYFSHGICPDCARESLEDLDRTGGGAP
jgi:methyl-accepting chemotaxis protein